MAVPTYRSASAVQEFTGDTTCVITKPTGTVDGDLLVAFFYAYNGFYDTAADLSPPAGWTTIAESLVANSPIVGIYYRIAASEGASYTWACNDGSERTMGMVCVEGGTFDATTPVGTSSGTDFSTAHDSSAGTTVLASAITPGVDECLGVAFWGALTPFGGFTSVDGAWTQRSLTDNDSMSCAIATDSLTTSSTGTVTATADVSVASNQGAAALVAVRPTAGAAGQPARKRLGGIPFTGTKGVW